MRFDFRDQIQRLTYFAIYDEDEIAFLRRTLREGDVFLDVGANVGYYSLVASQLVGPGMVHAFEPIPENRGVLRETVERNGIGNIVICPMAVGNSRGTIGLYVGAEDLGNSGWASIVPAQRRRSVVFVNTVTLDAYIAAQGIQRVRLVKIDVEGSEPGVIAGMARLIDGDAAPDILCEVNPWLLGQQGLDSTSITKPLAAAGYEIYRLGASANMPVPPTEPIEQFMNILCTKRAAPEGSAASHTRLSRKQIASGAQQHADRATGPASWRFQRVDFEHARAIGCVRTHGERRVLTTEVFQLPDGATVGGVSNSSMPSSRSTSSLAASGPAIGAEDGVVSSHARR
jgi:FkbM family methyltransferase